MTPSSTSTWIKSSSARKELTPACTSSRSTARLTYRSEEHTSELQSQSNLVCRLLLVKKNRQLLENTEARKAGKSHSGVNPHFPCLHREPLRRRQFRLYWFVAGPPPPPREDKLPTPSP